VCVSGRRGTASDAIAARVRPPPRRHRGPPQADYKGTDPKKAMADFMERVKQYEARYEPVDDAEECAYIKLVNVGDKVITRRCGGYLTSQLGFYLGNVHIQPRRIWLALHGESQLQVESRRVGAATGHLTPRGRCFARRLAGFVKDAHASFRQEHVDTDPEIVVLTGNAPIHSQTIKPLLADPLAFECPPRVSTSSLLNELCGGDFDGLSVKEIQDRYPAVWHRRMADKLRFRYPGAGGESYLDVINRLRPILIELERQRKSVLLVTHLAVQRCLYSYFTGTDAEAIPYLPLPAGAVLELTPTPHGTQVRTHILLPDDEVALTQRLKAASFRATHRSSSTQVSEHGVPSPVAFPARVPSHAQAAPQGKGSPVTAHAPVRLTS
jgi:6-phosphofructo-2-kinase